MNRTSRAKQFLPFDALVGFQEALREKEIELVSNMNFWEFRKSKKEQRKKDIL